MSDNEQHDLEALHELELLIRLLGDEMAAWRRRAQQAENRVRELERVDQLHLRPLEDQRVTALEEENRRLGSKLDSAREQTCRLLERVRFLRQQSEIGVER
ncbi:MAG: hypothetical protein H0W30_16885 [Gemmatimonadaceae bacterium]|nr:hypothetical protein [Gemmatimonadaceae bacterium]